MVTAVGWINISSETKETLLKEDEMTVELKMKEAGLKMGGKYEPETCQSRNKVAIVVPYRDRKDHLTVFLRYLHPFLQRQQLNYVIIVVEQSGIINWRDPPLYIIFICACEKKARRSTVECWWISALTRLNYKKHSSALSFTTSIFYQRMTAILTPVRKMENLVKCLFPSITGTITGVM